MSSFKKGKFSVEKPNHSVTEQSNDLDTVDHSNPLRGDTLRESDPDDQDNTEDVNVASDAHSEDHELSDNHEDGTDDSDCDFTDFPGLSRGDLDNDIINDGSSKFSSKPGLTPADIKAKQLVMNLARERRKRDEKRRLREERIQKKLLEDATHDVEKLRLERDEHIREQKRRQLQELPQLRQQKKREEEEKRKNASQIVRNYNKNGYKYKALETDHSNINDKINSLLREDELKKQEAARERINMIKEHDRRIDPKKQEILDKTLNLPNIHCDKSVIRKFKEMELKEREDKAREAMLLEKNRKEGLKLLKENKVAIKIDHKKALLRKEIFDKRITKPRQKVDIKDPRPWRNQPLFVPENPIPMKKILTPHQKEQLEVQKRRDNAQKANEYLQYQSFQRQEMTRRKQEELSKDILQSHLFLYRSNNDTPTQYTGTNSGNNSDDFDDDDDDDDDNKYNDNEYDNDYDNDNYGNDSDDNKDNDEQDGTNDDGFGDRTQDNAADDENYMINECSDQGQTTSTNADNIVSNDDLTPGNADETPIQRLPPVHIKA